MDEAAEAAAPVRIEASVSPACDFFELALLRLPAALPSSLRDTCETVIESCAWSRAFFPRDFIIGELSALTGIDFISIFRLKASDDLLFKMRRSSFMGMRRIVA